MSTSPILFLIRGIPGSGKSTLAKYYVKQYNAKHFEADMMFVDPSNGVYCYDPAYLKDAHDWCLNSTKSSLLNGQNTVVSNTFIKIWEVRKYLALGYPTKIIEMDPIVYNNTHMVPEETIERMKSNFESLL